MELKCVSAHYSISNYVFRHDLLAFLAEPEPELVPQGLESIAMGGR